MQIKPWKYPVIGAILAMFLWAWGWYGTTKGIDLAGGSVLIYQLELPNNKIVDSELTKSTSSILQRRLDTLGLKEMSIRPAGEDQVMIQLPGVSGDSVERIKKVIASSGKLFFKIVEKGNVRAQRSDPRIQEQIKEIEDEKKRNQYEVELNYFDTALYQVRDDETGAVTEQFHILLMNKDSDVVDGELLESASESSRLTLRPTVDFVMKASGRSKLASVTEKHQGKEMAIVLDGVVISAPTINEPITGGSGEISGQFSKEEIKELVTVLKSGALPAKPILQSEDTIAPTLGEDSIRRGYIAIGLGVVLTLLFMVFYYRLAGVIANLALIMNLLILLGVMSLFEATLTLPGIAGIVLTMGMAVDANILINERIREEANRGVPISEAVKAGYSNAFSAIIDSNLTTMFTAAILYYVGTGPIKGFAVTLGVGIGASLFTALWVTRALFELALSKGWYTKVNYLSLLSNPKFPFVGTRRPFVIGALIVANLGFVLFSVSDDGKYGIDFNGGSAVQMRLNTDDALTKKDVVERLAAIEREVEGKKVKPYDDIEVSPLGGALEDGKYVSFQVLRSSHGKDAVIPAAALAEMEPELDELAEEAEKAPLTAQQQFEVDLAQIFAAELVPSEYSEPQREEPEVDGKTMRRLSIDVRFDAAAADELEAKAIEEALQAGEEYAQGAAVTQLPDGPKGLKVFRVTSADQTYETSFELIETHLKNAIEIEHGRHLSNPFPFRTSIGAAVAEELKSRGILAILLSMLMMILYIAFRFEFKAGVAAVICLFHDVFTVLGFMMLFQFLGLDAKINLTTIAAFLTIVGYSINDTIVTFDRIRENMVGKKLERSSPEYATLVNDSINQVLSRTILTSVTVLLVLVVLAAAGVNTLQGFTLALIVGAVVGTFSSIYVATPLLLAEGKSIRNLVLIELGVVIGVTALAGQLLG